MITQFVGQIPPSAAWYVLCLISKRSSTSPSYRQPQISWSYTLPSWNLRVILSFSLPSHLSSVTMIFSKIGSQLHGQVFQHFWTNPFQPHGSGSYSFSKCSSACYSPAACCPSPSQILPLTAAGFACENQWGIKKKALSTSADYKETHYFQDLEPTLSTSEFSGHQLMVLE